MADKKFYKSDIIPKCGYCLNAKAISGGKEFFCLKKGLMSYDDFCKSFKYDPLKRTPKHKGIGRDFDPEDLKLD